MSLSLILSSSFDKTTSTVAQQAMVRPVRNPRSQPRPTLDGATPYVGQRQAREGPGQLATDRVGKGCHTRTQLGFQHLEFTFFSFFVLCTEIDGIKRFK